MVTTWVSILVRVPSLSLESTFTGVPSLFFTTSSALERSTGFAVKSSLLVMVVLPPATVIGRVTSPVQVCGVTLSHSLYLMV